MARAALRREESRGGHFRQDFPSRNDRDYKIHLEDQLQ
jgi:succinate dehydrogenase/fumarate reductase flavoprotein subunit